MPATIFVRSANQDRKVALSEADELHPGNHEAWVVGYPSLPDGSDDPANIVEVGQTALVRMKLASGDLIQVDRPLSDKERKAAEKAEAERKAADAKAEAERLAKLGQT